MLHFRYYKKITTIFKISEDSVVTKEKIKENVSLSNYVFLSRQEY